MLSACVRLVFRCCGAANCACLCALGPLLGQPIEPPDGESHFSALQQTAVGGRTVQTASATKSDIRVHKHLGLVLMRHISWYVA